MSYTCEDIAGLIEAAHSIIVLQGTLDKWLNGTETQDVILGGKTVPTLRKLVAMIDERESQAAQEAIAEGIRDVTMVKNQVLALKAQVQAEVNKLLGIEAQASSLPPGSQATASYNGTTGILSLGIPVGAKGDPGPAGPPGQAPVIDVINCGGAYETILQVIDGGNASSFIEEAA